MFLSLLSWWISVYSIVQYVPSGEKVCRTQLFFKQFKRNITNKFIRRNSMTECIEFLNMRKQNIFLCTGRSQWLLCLWKENSKFWENFCKLYKIGKIWRFEVPVQYYGYLGTKFFSLVSVREFGLHKQNKTEIWTGADPLLLLSSKKVDNCFVRKTWGRVLSVKQNRNIHRKNHFI